MNYKFFSTGSSCFHQGKVRWRRKRGTTVTRPRKVSWNGITTPLKTFDEYNITLTFVMKVDLISKKYRFVQ